MKTLLLSTVAALALTASSASASWTGCRVGITAGATATQTEANADIFSGFAAVGLDGFGTDGAEFGLLGGCDLQVADRFIVGAFMDYVFRDQEWKLTASGGGNSAQLSTEYGDEWGLGLRAGITVTPTTAIFMTVGYGEAKGGDITLSVDGANVGAIDLGDYKGWFVGGQMESEIAKNIFLGAEYRYHMYDTRRIDLAPAASIDLDTDAHTFRVNLAYRFGGANDTLLPTK